MIIINLHYSLCETSELNRRIKIAEMYNIVYYNETDDQITLISI